MTFDELLKLDKQEEAKSSQQASLQLSGRRRANAAKARSEARPVVEDTKSDAMRPRHHDTVVPRRHTTIRASVVKLVRKRVKQVGKEAATHRFTREEKDGVANIVYRYGRQGYRTSENEVTRIGVNWLMEDYRENGKRSVLHRVLKALKE